MQERLNGRMERQVDTLGKRLRLARKKRALTQHDLAEAAGLKQGDISKIEGGTIQKTTGIARLARALCVPPEWLEDGAGPEPQWDAVPWTGPVTFPLTSPLPSPLTPALLAAFERIGAELEAADPAARRAIASLLKDLADAPGEAPKLGVLAQRLLAPAEVPVPAAKEPEAAREPEWNGVNRRTHNEPVKTERRRSPLGVIDDHALGERPRKKAAAWTAGGKT
jgi:transcriptional regulator with XRE-family HTH domain